MKSFDAKKILSIVFICLIVFFMGTIGVKYVMLNILHIDTEETNITESQPDQSEVERTDWSKDYPFSGNYGFEFHEEITPIEEREQASTIDQIETFVRSIEGNIDYYTSNLLFGRMSFVELNASFNKFIGMNIVSGADSVVAMRNGYLTFEAFPLEASFAQESTTYFSQWLKDRNINFLYVQCPSKEDPFDNQLPSGIEDNNNLNADNIVKQLAINGVPYLDLRKNLAADFDNHYSCFFKTDHHWLPETGVWAAGQIANELNKRYNYDIDPEIGNLSNYNIDIYENHFLGSQGKKATLKYTDPENFSLIYPKTNTDFTVQFENQDEISGSFEKTLLDLSHLETIDYYNNFVYSTYFRGNPPITTIHNNKLDNGKRVVYLMDSFSACVIPFLAMEVEDMLVLDLRSFNGSVTTAIGEFNPDTVIVAYNPSTLSADTSHYGTFNFE